ncbi:MAG: hypothetical protein QOK43_2026 [Acidimicrobiaceae bacterium]|jgi:hypothetical protein|nr:hypothetical protein [Acidimicrobiaceae bacterium]MDQ1443801.1 hypothetical protein [Acidimicrobiaceae bacterium]
MSDLEAEGIPPIEDNPPGIGGDNEVEGMIPPGDTPQGVDQWGTTAREEQSDEPLAERVRRELPDVEPGDDGHVGRLVQQDQGMIDMDVEAEEVATMTGDDAGLSAEEAAMHITDVP